MPRNLLDRWRGLTKCGLGCCNNCFANRSQYIIFGYKTHFGIELHELVLAICSQVFVTQASSNLVVPVDTSNHQQLLPQLRRLRQRIKRSRLFARRNQKFTGTLWSGWHQKWSLNLNKILGFHCATNCRVDLGSNAQVLLHPLAANIEIAELEANAFIHIVGTSIDWKRRRLGGIQHCELTLNKFDTTRWEVGVNRSFWSSLHLARYLHHPLVTNILHIADHTLHYPGIVTYIKERQVFAMFTATSDPSAQSDGLTNVLWAQTATQLCAQRRRVD